MKRFKTTFANILGVLCFLFGTAVRVSAAPAPTPPDLKQGRKREESHDWLLGPTVARGWMFSWQEDQTAAFRQILVISVEAESPADGVLLAMDVILERERPDVRGWRSCWRWSRSLGYEVARQEVVRPASRLKY